MHRINYLLKDGFQVLALATQAVFEFANVVAGEHFYQIDNFSLAGGATRSSLGMTITVQPLSASSGADTWMVVGVGNPLETPTSNEEIAFLRHCSLHARRLASICTGAFMLAEAGLLNQRRATTHWYFAAQLQERHPAIQVEADRIYIVDGAIWTSAGMTAGIDMALAMVEKDLGTDVARGVAHRLVMSQHRSGGQAQHSELLDLAPKSDRVQNALNYARKHLAGTLTVEQLAEQVNLSPRQFSRVFTEETGQSPAKAIEGLRLEAARLMIERSRHPLDVIAQETGFRDRRHLRSVFMRGFGVAPQALRREGRGSTVAVAHTEDVSAAQDNQCACPSFPW